MSFCGYDDNSDTEFGLGIHISRWCEESPPDEEISRKLMSRKGSPMFGREHSEKTKYKMRESTQIQMILMKGRIHKFVK